MVNFSWQTPTLSPEPSPYSEWRIGETPGQGCQNGSKNSWGFCPINTMKCLRFCWTMDLDCKKTNRGARRWKQPPKKSFHHVSRDKILQDSWSISAALAGGSSDRHFERGEGPGDEVGQTPVWSQMPSCQSVTRLWGIMGVVCQMTGPFLFFKWTKWSISGEKTSTSRTIWSVKQPFK